MANFLFGFIFTHFFMTTLSVFITGDLSNILLTNWSLDVARVFGSLLLVAGGCVFCLGNENSTAGRGSQRKVGRPRRG